MVTIPVKGSKVMPVGHVPLVATVAFPEPPNVAATPLTRSLDAILDSVPPVAEDTLTLSVTGSMTTGVLVERLLVKFGSV